MSLSVSSSSSSSSFIGDFEVVFCSCGLSCVSYSIHGIASLKEKITQSDQHLVNLSSKTYVFEDKLTKYNSV